MISLLVENSDTVEAFLYRECVISYPGSDPIKKQNQGVITYYQVTADMTAEETFEREMRPLRSIQDNYEKIVLTLDRFSLGNYDGIKVVNVIDWLLA